MEGRAGQDQAVEERDGDAGVDAAAQRSQHAAGGGAVKVERVAVAPMNGRDDEGLDVVFAWHNESHVADQGLVEDGVDRLSVVRTPAGKAAKSICILTESIRHSTFG